MTLVKIGAEWCLFHPSGREVARSTNLALLQSYAADIGAEIKEA